MSDFTVKIETATASSAAIVALLARFKTVANNFDPSVTGLAAPINSFAATVDGSVGWMKVGNADTAWIRTNME
jgi:hypothetical protein